MTLATARERWERFWFPPRTPHRMAGFRILLGLYLLGYFAALAPHVALLFSSHGVYVPFLVPDYAPPPVVAGILFGLTLLLALAVTLGFRTRVTVPLLLLAFLHHYFLGIAVSYTAYDRLIVIYLVVLTFAEGGRVWALTPAASNAPHPACGWGERVLTLQAFMLYFGSGLWKLMNPAWHDGSLLESVHQGMWATPVAFWISGLDLGPQIWTLFAWMTIALELLVGIGFLFRRTQGWAMLGAASFHLANSVILFIPEFLVCVTLAPIFASDSVLQSVAAQLSQTCTRGTNRSADTWTKKGSTGRFPEP
jgi:hypothetical protein